MYLPTLLTLIGAVIVAIASLGALRPRRFGTPLGGPMPTTAS